MNDKNICYCCHEENEGKWITIIEEKTRVIVSRLEHRWVCNNCHQINEKTDLLVITKQEDLLK